MSDTTQAERGNILVVDDTPANLRLLAQLLTEQGYKARALPRGNLVRPAVEVEPPDLILLDVNMPEMNGYQVCSELKANQATRDIPVIFISALDDVQDKVKAFTTGGVDYITKPFKHEEVVARVDTHLALRRLQLELQHQHRQLQLTTSQLQAITDSLTQFLQTHSQGEAVNLLLSCALEQTGSRLGWVGVVTGSGESEVVRILALQGECGSRSDAKALVEAMQRDLASEGHSDQSLAALESVVGPVISQAREALADNGGSWPPITSRDSAQPGYLGVPVVQASEVVGLMVVGERQEDYDSSEHERIARLSQAAGVLFEYERMQRRQAETERGWQRAEEHVRYLQDSIKSEHNFDEIIGQSEPLRRVLAQVERVAKTDSTVLILGETGTGKELIARAIHERSARKSQPLIKINCAALPDNLVESELFGHEKGAFTGSTGQRKGRFELADGGTLFLDEVGDMPAATQVKLLRTLQEQEFERVGGNMPIRVDVRVLAATHRDLNAMVAEGEFREDLYYRLNVFPLDMPPLRERRDDVVPLAEFFLRRFVTKFDVRIKGIANDTVERLRAYRWPGNIRELENIVERAVILANGEILEIAPSLLPSKPASNENPAVPEASQQAQPNAPADGLATMEEVERGHIRRALAAADGAVGGARGAAAILGLNPSTLRNRIRKLGLSKQSKAT